MSVVTSTVPCDDFKITLPPKLFAEIDMFKVLKGAKVINTTYKLSTIIIVEDEINRKTAVKLILSEIINISTK